MASPLVESEKGSFGEWFNRLSLFEPDFLVCFLSFCDKEPIGGSWRCWRWRLRKKDNGEATLLSELSIVVL